MLRLYTVALIALLAGLTVYFGGSFFMSKQTLKQSSTTITRLQTENSTLAKKLQQLSIVESDEIPQPLLSVTELDLMEDILVTYPHLSDQQKRIIIDTIFEASEAYSINPFIIYSLIHAESSFRFWIEHSQVTINGQKMRAVGLGGIMWYWWGEMLSEAKIASTRSELFDPVTNIRAIVHIYHHLTTISMHKDASNIHHSAMLRYFGGSYSHYIKSIEAKMMTIIQRKLYLKDTQ